MHKAIIKVNNVKNFVKVSSFSTSTLKSNTNLQYEFRRPFDLHKLESGPKTKVSCSKEEALDAYKKMQTIRNLETTASNLYSEQKIRGFCHLSTGQEAICVGIKAALDENDSVITAYRDHGWAFIMNIPLLGIIAEVTGRKTGSSKGKGGSMHFYGKNFYGGHGIVGAHVPIGTGVALVHKYRNQKQVCVTSYGDGAANQGQVFESFNMAKLWNLPVIYVCENNKYGMGTPVNEASASTDFYTRGDFVPGIRLDGNDIFQVREATSFAREYALENGPIVLEMITYRYAGHSMSDPGTSYRSHEEVQKQRETNDPIKRLGNMLLEQNVASSSDLKEINASIKKTLNETADKALNDPELDVKEMYNHIYKEQDKMNLKIRGCDNFTTFTL